MMFSPKPISSLDQFLDMEKEQARNDLELIRNARKSWKQVHWKDRMRHHITTFFSKLHWLLFPEKHTALWFLYVCGWLTLLGWIVLTLVLALKG